MTTNTENRPSKQSTTGPLAGQVAVVTGAGQGIGASFALHLAELGCNVVVIDRDADKAAHVAGQLPLPGLALAADVSDEAQVRAARDSTMEHFGRIDILVNSAAIFSSIQMKSYSELCTAEWDEVMAVNVRGTFLCCREFGGPMRDAGYGRIVNMSSGTVYMGRPHYLHYVTSKAAVIGLTRALSKELGTYGVTVNAIAPGSTKTEVVRAAMTDKDADAIIARQAIKRRQEPVDLLSALTFLTEQSSDFVTGQTLIVDGGVSFS